MAVGLNPNWAREAFLAKGETLSDDDLNLDWFDFFQKYEMLLIGSPDFVAERIDKFHRLAHLVEQQRPRVAVTHVIVKRSVEAHGIIICKRVNA